jgi:hypothetical protein
LEFALFVGKVVVAVDVVFNEVSDSNEVLLVLTLIDEEIDVSVDCES